MLSTFTFKTFKTGLGYSFKLTVSNVSLSKPAGNSSASYYVNGVLVGTGTAYTTLVSTPTLFNRGAAQTWKGNGAVVQIYNRALSATEVLQNYNATKTRFGL